MALEFICNIKGLSFYYPFYRVMEKLTRLKAVFISSAIRSVLTYQMYDVLKNAETVFFCCIFFTSKSVLDHHWIIIFSILITGSKNEQIETNVIIIIMIKEEKTKKMRNSRKHNPGKQRHLYAHQNLTLRDPPPTRDLNKAGLYCGKKLNLITVVFSWTIPLFLARKLFSSRSFFRLVH